MSAKIGLFAVLSFFGASQLSAQFLIESFPADGARNVPRNTRIGLMFRGPVNFFGYSFNLRRAGTTTAINVSSSGSTGAMHPQFPSLLFRPFPVLEANTAYEAEFATSNGRQILRFTTGNDLDTTAPKIVSIEPEDGAADIDPYQPIRVTFDKPMSGADGVVTANSGELNYLVRPAIGRPGWRTLEMVPSYSGLPPIRPTLRIFPEGFADMSGNRPAQGEIVRQWTTSLRDRLVSLQLLGQYPLPGETGVPTNAQVQLLFDRQVFSANRESIVIEGGGQRLSPSFDSSGRVVYVSVSSLAPDTLYKVTIAENAFGEQNRALAAPVSFEFTTGSGPLVVSQPTDEVSPPFSLTDRFPVNAKMALRSSTPLPLFAPQLLAGSLPLSSSLLEDRRTLVVENVNREAFRSISASFDGLRDILGNRIRNSSFSMRTNGEVDNDAPVILATTPADGASNVPVSTPIRVRVNERVSVITPETSFRLLKNGTPVETRFSLILRAFYETSGDFVDIVPSRPLDPETEYTLEIGSILDMAMNASAPRTIRFRTGVVVSNPPFPRLVRVTSQTDPIGPMQPVEYEFDQPLSQASTRVQAELVVPVPGNSPRSYRLPFRLEFAGGTLRIVPLSGWPANRRISVALYSQDLSGRELSMSNAFPVGPSNDGTPPQIVAVTPTAGTLITNTIGIRIEFSKPMLPAGDLNGGFLFSDSIVRFAPRGEWSADLKSFAFEATIPNYQDAVPSKYSLSVAEALTDLAGNPVRSATFVWPLAPVSTTTTQIPSVVRAWPAKEPFASALLSGLQPLQLLFNGPVDAGTLNRDWWVVNEVRMEGVWTTEGALASFAPSVAWRPGAVTLLPIGTTTSPNPAGFQATVLAPAERGSVARVLGSSVSPSAHHPLDAVIEVEFDRDPPPAGAMQVRAAPRFGFQQMSPVAITEARVRPGVVRYRPVNPLPLDGNIGVNSTPGSTVVMDFASSITTISAATNQPVPKARYLSPAPESTDVPRNAILSVLLDGGLNPVSLESSVKVSVQETGIAVPVRLEPNIAMGGALLIWPQTVLPANSWILVKIDGWIDRSGRSLTSAEWRFRTGQRLELTPPRVLASSTLGLSTALVVDPFEPIWITVDRPLDPAQTERAFRSSSNGAPFDWTLSADRRTFSLTPPAAGWNRGESISVRFSCVDVAGNGLSPGFAFQVPFEANPTPLELTAISLRDGDRGLPLNLRFGFRFSGPPNGDAPNQIVLKDASGQRIALRRTGFNTGPRVVNLLPEVLLNPNSDYELTVGNIAGGNGRPLANPRTIRFRTGDRMDLELPVGAIRVGLADEPIVIRFSEPMDPSGLSENPLTWIDWRGGSGFTRVVPVRSDWAADRQTLTVTPLQPLRNLEHQLNLGRVEDLAGNATGSIGAGNFEYRFTPPETLPPPPSSAAVFSPADGSANVPLNVRLAVLLNVTASSPVSVKLFENDKLTDAPVSSFLTGANLTYGLAPGVRYRIELAAFIDLYGRSHPAQSATFTTGSQRDGSAFRFVSSTPASSEAGVDPRTPWTLTFDKPLWPSSAGLETPTSSPVFPFGIRYEFNREKITATPTPSWPAAATIQWSPGSGGFFGRLTDWTGNQMFTPVSLSFRTAAINDPTPPKLLSISPEPGTLLDAGPLAYIVLRFSKPVSFPSGALQMFQGSKLAPVGMVYSPDFTTVTLSFLPEGNSRITILGSDAIRDDADNRLEPFVIEYPTGEQVPYGTPTWRLIEPVNTQRAPANTPVRLQFDRAMNVASAQGAIRLTENGQNISGTIQASADGKIFTFQFARPYAAGSTVRVFVLPTMIDVAGLPVQSQFAGPGATFFVEPPPSTELPAAPTATLAIVRRGFHATAPANGVLEVEFNQELDVGTIQMDSVWLRLGSRLIAGTPSLRDGRILRFEPSEPLQAGETYVLTAGSALRSVGGGTFAGQDLRFTAADALQGGVDIASSEEIEWRGRPAVRVRMTQPLSRIALPEAPNAEVLPGVDPHEFLVVFADRETPAVTLSFDRSFDAAGRAIAAKRKTIARKTR